MSKSKFTSSHERDLLELHRLLKAARSGDAKAADELFAGASPNLETFIQLRMGPRLRASYDPLDVLQEVWVAALEGIEQFEPRGRGSFNAWLCRIAERRLAGLARRGGAQKRDAPMEPHPGSALVRLHRASATGPFSAAAKLEEREALQQAIADLSDEDRRALLMRHFEELPLEEIAHRLGCSETSVRRRLGRLLTGLGRALG